MRLTAHRYLAGALLLLAGCTASPLKQEPVEPVADAEQAPQMEPPAAELTPQRLFELLIAEFAIHSDNLRLSADRFLSVARETGDYRLAKRATQFAIYASDFELAYQSAKLWVELEPDSIEAQQSMAALLLRNDETDAALAHMEAIISLSQENPAHGYLVIVSLLSREHTKEVALPLMHRLVEPRSTDPEALYAYANLANKLGENQMASDILKRLLAIYPDMEKALILNAKTYIALGKNQQALDSLAQAIANAPNNEQLRLTYARMLVDARQLEKARKQFHILHRQQPKDADVLFALGLLALESGDDIEAKTHLETLLKLGQRSDEAHYMLGQLAEKGATPQQAIEHYQAVEEGSYYIDAQVRISQLLLDSQGMEAARNYLSGVAPHSAEEQIDLYIAEVELLRSAAQFEEAITVYNRALEQYPDNTDLLYARAMLWENLNRLDEMERDMQTLLGLDPNNVHALNAWGYTLADRTDRYEEAYRLIERAYNKLPTDPAIIDSMGWALYKLGRYDEALKFLQQAASLLQDGEIYAHLGEVLWHMGEQDKAKSIWDEALKFAPDNPVLRQIIERHTP